MSIIPGVLAFLGLIKGGIEKSKMLDNEKVKLVRDLDVVRTEISTKVISLEQELVTAQQKVLLADARSDSALQRNWRPIAVYLLLFMLVEKLLLAPYLNILFDLSLPTTITTGFYLLASIVTGTFGTTRGLEKIARLGGIGNSIKTLLGSNK